MLMLDSEQVKYCQVTDPVDDKQETVSGLIYNGKVFILAKSFDKSELQQAIKECREDYLDHEVRSQIPTLLVKGKKSVDIWLQDNRYQSVGEAPVAPQTSQSNTTTKPSIDKISLRKMSAEMRSKDGVAIKTRRHKLKLYQRCFVGSEAVDWIVKKYGFSRADAVLVGQKLINKKIIHHVEEGQPFEDRDLYYRFSEDEGKSIWTDKIV